MIGWFQNLDERKVFIGLVVIALASLGLSAISHGLNGDAAWWGWADSAFQNFSTEMMGAIVTFGLFELILGAKKRVQDKFQSEEKEKRKLIIQLRSIDNATTLNALDQVRANLWHVDGTLKKADLFRANLQGANLSLAQLQNVNLIQANLQNAMFNQANLQNAVLLGANLRGAVLMQASLQGADLESVTFNENTVLPDAVLELQGNLRLCDKYWTPETDMTRYTDANHPNFWQPDWVKAQE